MPVDRPPVFEDHRELDPSPCTLYGDRGTRWGRLQFPGDRGLEGCPRDAPLGSLRHVATWQVESYANQIRSKSWKSMMRRAADRSSTSSRITWILEWLVARSQCCRAAAAMLGDTRPNDTFVAIALQFASGAAGSLVMSAAAYRGPVYRLDFYGRGWDSRPRQPHDGLHARLPPTVRPQARCPGRGSGAAGRGRLGGQFVGWPVASPIGAKAEHLQTQSQAACGCRSFWRPPAAPMLAADGSS
jgi:hypothetical protein